MLKLLLLLVQNVVANHHSVRAEIQRSRLSLLRRSSRGGAGGNSGGSTAGGHDACGGGAGRG